MFTYLLRSIAGFLNGYEGQEVVVIDEIPQEGISRQVKVKQNIELNSSRVPLVLTQQSRTDSL